MHDVTHDAHGARLSEQGGDGAETRQRRRARGDNKLNESCRVSQDPAVYVEQITTLVPVLFLSTFHEYRHLRCNPNLATVRP